MPWLSEVKDAFKDHECNHLKFKHKNSLVLIAQRKNGRNRSSGGRKWSGKKLQLTDDVWLFFRKCVWYGRHFLAPSVYHERSPYIIEIALEFAVIGKIKLHDFIHIRSVFVLFACSLSLDFMKAGWKTGRLYWLLVSFLVFMAFNASTLTPPLEAGWQS